MRDDSVSGFIFGVGRVGSGWECGNFDDSFFLEDM